MAKKTTVPEWMSASEFERQHTIDGKPAITRQTIGKHSRDGRIRKRGSTGRLVKYNVSDMLKVMEEVVSNKRTRAETIESAQDKRALECERLIVIIKKERELLEQAKLETARQKGEIVAVDEVRTVHRQMISATKAGCESWRAEQTAMVKTAKDKKKVDNLVNGFLAAMIECLSKWEDGQ
jgi:hypothetical protein